MSRKLILCLSVAFALTAAWADSTWIGTVYSGEQGPGDSEWSDPKNWEGGVPTGDAKATVRAQLDVDLEQYVDKDMFGRALALTPPLDFTGTIDCKYDGIIYTATAPTILKLTVLPGACWHVSGNGLVYATDGLSERVAPEFAGMIVVQKGQSFTASATLDDSVMFGGDGTLTLTKASQLSHLAGFVGKVIWAGESELSPTDTTLIQGCTVELRNGTKLNYPVKSLFSSTKAMPGFEVADAWQFNGGIPGVGADGELSLVTANGEPVAQIRSAVFKRRFNFTDAWAIHFTCKAGTRGGEDWPSLGVFLAQSADTVGTTLQFPVPCRNADNWETGAFGFTMTRPLDRLYWWLPYTKVGGVLKTDAANAMGAVFDYTKAIDYDVSYQNGRLSVTMTQDGKTFTTWNNMYNEYSAQRMNQYRINYPDGFYLAIGASGKGFTEWAIEGFRGWYHASDGEAWRSVGDPTDFYPINPDKWAVRLFKDSGNVVIEGDAAINSFDGGSFTIQPFMYSRAMLGSKVALDWTKRYMVDFDFGYGTYASAGQKDVYTETIQFGFCLSPYLTSGDGAYVPFAPGYPYTWATLESGTTDSWSRPYLFRINAYQKTLDFYRYAEDPELGHANRFIYDCVPSVASWPQIPRNTIHVQMFYDGQAGSIELTTSGSHAVNYKWQAPAGTFTRADGTNSLYLAFAARTEWAYVDTTIRNITVREMADNNTSDFTGTLAVAPGAKAEFGADAYIGTSETPAVTLGKVELAAGAELDITSGVEGTRVVLESIALADGASLVAETPTKLMPRFDFVGSMPVNGVRLKGVTLDGDALTLVVPDEWKANHEKGPLLDLDGSDLAIDVSKVRILTASGKDVTRRCNPTVKDGSLLIDFAVGMMLFVR